MFGEIIATAGSIIGGNKANKAAKNLAREQMRFQERMARNAHQYEVEDLRKAGLNPILSAGGGGAATPSGATAPVLDVVSPAISSAMAARRNNAEIENMREQNALLKDQQAKTTADTKLSDALAISAKAEASSLSVRADFSGQGPGLLKVFGNGRDQPCREFLERGIVA